MGDDGLVPPSRPDAAQRAAAHQLELTRRLRVVEDAILARAPEHDLQPSLDRIDAVMDLLGQPQRTFPSIHLTGTNGKTSTTRLVDVILREHQLSTGRFTSPHLHSMTERIALSGQPISTDAFLAAYEEVAPILELVDVRSRGAGGPAMTYFEVLVAIAYAAFADAPIDVGVIEVGLGGSWDATNVIDAAVAVIAPIALDHRHFLGDTVEQIAAEKVGIIKPGSIVVAAEQPYPAAAEIIAARAEEVGARLVVGGRDVGVLQRAVAVGGQQITVQGLAGEYRDLFLPVHGPHQAGNAALAVTAVEAFLGGGEQALDTGVLAAALARATSPGRLEVVRRSPTVLVDAAHNPAGMRALVEAVEDAFTFTRLVAVVAILADKDAEEMLQILEPLVDHVVVSRTTSPRALSPRRLGALAGEVFGEHRVTVADDLPDAVDIAGQLADEAGPAAAVLATGSVTTAAEVRMLLGHTQT